MERTVVVKSSALKEYLSLVAALPRMDEASQEQLGKSLSDGDAACLPALVESFLPMVVAEAAARRGLGVRFEVLIAAGNRGLAFGLRHKKGALRQRVLREIRRSLREALVKASFRRPLAL